MKPHITKLLVNTITKEELLKLKEWFANPKNQSTLEAFIKDDHDLNLAMIKNNKDEAFNKVINKIEKNEKTKVVPLYKRSLFKYAVAILILVSSGYLFLTNGNNGNNFDPNTPIIVSNNIVIGTDKAILTLEDGSQISLEKGENYSADNLNSNGEEIIYNASVSVKKEISYNYLTIPRGGEYYVKLSDGTQVWLNSESKLKYPVAFQEGKTRQVELLYGEAYFDVSPSKNHKGSKFKVFTGIQEVEVLGTEFNVKAYRDENHIYTTLVEGKVSVKNSFDKEILKPNEQTIFNINNKDFVINKVDTYSEIAWKRGLFSFREKSLKDIMKVLSRWYDIDVVFVDKNMENILFTGILSKEQNIEYILSLIYKTNKVTYEINDKMIYFR